MTDSTFDKARRCPSCDQLGRAAGVVPAETRRQGSFHVFKCENERCQKFDRDWIVQVRPDGTVPEPTTNREKSFPQDKGVAKGRIEKARNYADNLVNQSLEK